MELPQVKYLLVPKLAPVDKKIPSTFRRVHSNVRGRGIDSEKSTHREHISGLHLCAPCKKSQCYPCRQLSIAQVLVLDRRRALKSNIYRLNHGARLRAAAFGGRVQGIATSGIRSIDAQQRQHVCSLKVENQRLIPCAWKSIRQQKQRVYIRSRYPACVFKAL
jgi:hypothetical protein